jgi:hypothetical protein
MGQYPFIDKDFSLILDLRIADDIKYVREMTVCGVRLPDIRRIKIDYIPSDSSMFNKFLQH